METNSGSSFDGSCGRLAAYGPQRVTVASIRQLASDRHGHSAQAAQVHNFQRMAGGLCETDSVLRPTL